MEAGSCRTVSVGTITYRLNRPLNEALNYHIVRLLPSARGGCYRYDRPVIEDSTNRIIRSLSPASRTRLEPLLERVGLRRGQVLSQAGARISHSYFIESGMVSLIRPMQNGQGVEIGAVGPEGIVPPGAAVELKRSIVESIVQIPGTALRIRCDELAQVLEHDRDLLVLVRAYEGAAFNQLAQTAACNILHLVDQRCCRWLLQAHDCAGTDSFGVTHELLGMVLGVRRATVSAAAERLQRGGMIRYRHGKVTILIREALERAACECYAATRAEFAALFHALGG
jgi:CRP-like cAMP-binding protein